MQNFFSYMFIVNCILMMNAFGEQDSIIIDNSDSLFSSTGTWNTSTRDKPFHGKNYLWARKSIKSTATWYLPISKDGEFELFIWFCASRDDDRASNAKYTINHRGGSQTFTISQKPSAKLNNRWHRLGIWEFSSSAEKSARNITLDNSGADHSVSADAVKAIYISKTNIPTIETTNRNHNSFIKIHGIGEYAISWNRNINTTSANLYQIPTGKIIHQWTNLPSGIDKMTFTLGVHLPAGIYALVLQTDDHIVYFKRILVSGVNN